MDGIGENSDGEIADAGSGCSTVRSDEEVDNVGGAAGVAKTSALSLKPRLALEAERRMVGVRRDSRALGSSSVVNFPMAGR